MEYIFDHTERCASCDTRKDPSEFYRSGDYCKECAKQKARDYHAANRDKSRERSREYQQTPHARDKRLRDTYGISLEDYDRMLASQAGVCAICKSPPRRTRRLGVDHDHDTGAIRGLLCTTCNVGLGSFRDNTNLLCAAIDYLDIAEANTNDLGHSTNDSDGMPD